MSLRYNALLLAVITTLVAIAGAWSGDEALAGAWRLPLGLLLLGLAFEGWVASRAQLRLEAVSEPRGVLGRPTVVEFALDHRLARTLTVELAPDAPEAVHVEGGVRSVLAPADETSCIELRATPLRLGRHVWPAVRARIGGPLNLGWWSRRLPVNFTLHATPEMLQDPAQRMGALACGVKARVATGSGAEVLQLRDYRPGEPLHLIDWKATARSGRLVSRDFSEDQHLEIVIAIDVGRSSALRAGELDRLGHYANIAARFAEHAVAQDDRVGLLLFADQPLAALAPGRGIGAVLRIRELLSATKSAAAESNPLNAALRIRTLVRHRSLILMLTELDDATVAGHLASAARLLLPKHLPLIAGLASPEAERLSHAPAHSWLDPYESLAAQEYCSQLERNVRALRALGAPALLARPEQMEQAVFSAYAGFRRRRRV